MTLTHFRRLRDAISSLAQCPSDILRPGTNLLPSSMSIPSRPEADFLWGSLGSMIVSERIKQSFADVGFTGTVCLPIPITKIGRRRAKLPAPIPKSGEPEDIMRLARDAPGPDVGQYFEMMVTADSHRVRETKPTFVCATCGFEQWTPPKKWAMEESLWTGADVFFLAPTTMVVVTDRVKQHLVQLGATNVRAVPVG